MERQGELGLGRGEGADRKETSRVRAWKVTSKMPVRCLNRDEEERAARPNLELRKEAQAGKGLGSQLHEDGI